MLEFILLFLLDFRISELVTIAFNVLEWAVRYSYIFCLLIFALVMVKTLVDLVKKYSPPSGKISKRKVE